MSSDEHIYNLKQMLEEIKEDETITPHTSKTISQAEINKRVLQKRKEAKR